MPEAFVWQLLPERPCIFLLSFKIKHLLLFTALDCVRQFACFLWLILFIYSISLNLISNFLTQAWQLEINTFPFYKKKQPKKPLGIVKVLINVNVADLVDIYNIQSNSKILS